MQEDLLDNFFDQSFYRRFQSNPKIQTPSNLDLFCCGFDSCTNREPFKSQKAAKEHYRRFHKDDLLDLEDQKMEAPPIMLRGGLPKSLVRKASTRTVPVMREPAVELEEDDDGEYVGTEDSFTDEEELPTFSTTVAKKRSRSTKKTAKKAPQKRKTKAASDSEDDPALKEKRTELEKVQKASSRNKSLSTKKKELEELHETLVREGKFDAVDEELELQKKVEREFNRINHEIAKELIASATTIVNVVDNPEKRKEQIRKVVINLHAILSPSREKLDRKHFIKQASYIVNDCITPNVINHYEGVITNRKLELQSTKSDFTAEFDGFHNDEQVLLDYAESVTPNDVKRAVCFAKIYYEQLMLHMDLKNPQFIAAQTVKEVLQQRIESVKLTELNS
jgi:hypothetical protein